MAQIPVAVVGLVNSISGMWPWWTVTALTNAALVRANRNPPVPGSGFRDADRGRSPRNPRGTTAHHSPHRLWSMRRKYLAYQLLDILDVNEAVVFHSDRSLRSGAGARPGTSRSGTGTNRASQRTRTLPVHDRSHPLHAITAAGLASEIAAQRNHGPTTPANSPVYTPLKRDDVQRGEARDTGDAEPGEDERQTRATTAECFRSRRRAPTRSVGDSRARYVPPRTTPAAAPFPRQRRAGINGVYGSGTSRTATGRACAMVSNTRPPSPQTGMLERARKMNQAMIPFSAQFISAA